MYIIEYQENNHTYGSYSKFSSPEEATPLLDKYRQANPTTEFKIVPIPLAYTQGSIIVNTLKR